MKATGMRVSKIVDAFIAKRPRVVQLSLNALTNDKRKGPSEADILNLRNEIIAELGLVSMPCAAEPNVHTELDAVFLETWRVHAGDLDHEIVKWLLAGAPAGILHHSEGPALGIFPLLVRRLETTMI